MPGIDISSLNILSISLDIYFLLDPFLDLTPHMSGYVLTMAYLKLKMWLADQTHRVFHILLDTLRY